MVNYHRQVLALTDDELEKFVRDWTEAKKSSYEEVVRFSGSGDLGRDVVGFLSAQRHEGDWHNYQCKQYGNNLPTGTAIKEIGKILYHANKGEFTAPSKYFFVAPRGINRNLESLIFKPTEFKKKLMDEWDQHCGEGIVEGSKILLEGSLLDFVNAYDFSRIGRLKLDEILADASAKPTLFKWFGADPGPAPEGQVPSDIQSLEMPYVNQLVDAYGQRDGVQYSDFQQIQAHPNHGNHLTVQRVRFYDADAFKRFYRDNTDKNVIDTFEKDIFHGVFDVCESNHQDALDRVNSVMSQAAQLQPSGPLAPHARVTVKQGICHHFANEDKIRWRK
jgi:hypothetical protein